MLYGKIYQSPLGEIFLESDGTSLCGLYLEGQRSQIELASKKHQMNVNLAIFKECKKWLDMYFKALKPNFTPKITLNGTPFRLEVWQMLRELDYAKTTTYGAIAQKLAHKKGIAKMSSRAVGSAVGKNPISIIIPCHRVLGVNQKLTGYTGGLEKKIALLELEGVKDFKL